MVIVLNGRTTLAYGVARCTDTLTSWDRLPAAVSAIQESPVAIAKWSVVETRRVLASQAFDKKVFPRQMMGRPLNKAKMFMGYWRSSINWIGLLLLCAVVACNLQSNRPAIERQRFDSLHKDCHVEILVDARTEEVLLGYVLLHKSQTFSEVDLRTQDGPVVSVTNLYLHSPGVSSFGFGSGWNRSTEVVVIDSTEFNRKSGCFFFVVDDGSDKKVSQLKGELKVGGIDILFSELREKNGEQNLVEDIDAASSRMRQ